MEEDPSPLGGLKSEDIVGRTLVAITGTFEEGYGVCDFANTFYRLDSGTAFALPGLWCDTLAAVEPPPDAKPIEHPLMEHLLGQQIVDVYRPAPEARLPDDSPYVLLRNGYMFSDIMGSPKGIGDQGLWVYRPGDIDTLQLLPFWGHK